MEPPIGHPRRKSYWINMQSYLDRFYPFWIAENAHPSTEKLIRAAALWSKAEGFYRKWYQFISEDDRTWMIELSPEERSWKVPEWGGGLERWKVAVRNQYTQSTAVMGNFWELSVITNSPPWYTHTPEVHHQWSTASLHNPQISISFPDILSHTHIS